MYINQTNQWYGEGEFVANIMIQGVYQDSVANMTGKVTVCENRPHIEDINCTRVTFGYSEFIFDNQSSEITFKGDSNLLAGTLLHHWEYQLTEEGVVVCVKLGQAGQSMRQVIDTYLSLVVTTVSSACLILTLMTYCLFDELRNLPGLNMMSLSFDTLSYQLLILFGVNDNTATKYPIMCKWIAIVIHYEVLCVFYWSNIMAWDLYQTFGRKALLSQVRSRKYYVRYMIYAKGLPMVLVGLSVLMDHLQTVPALVMGYGRYVCWITSKTGAMLMLALPLGIVIVSNGILFIKTIFSIRYVSKKVQGSKHGERGKSDLILYVRIFSILGFTWIFGLLPILIPDDVSNGIDDLSVVSMFLFVIFNGMQGTFIFFVFTANKRVLKLYQNRFETLRKRSSKPVKCTCPVHPQTCYLDSVIKPANLDKTRSRKRSSDSNYSNVSSLTRSTSNGSMVVPLDLNIDKLFEHRLSDVQEEDYSSTASSHNDTHCHF